MDSPSAAGSDISEAGRRYKETGLDLYNGHKTRMLKIAKPLKNNHNGVSET